MRIVLDTSVVVAGLRTRLGVGNAILRLVARRRLVLLATPPLFSLGCGKVVWKSAIFIPPGSVPTRDRSIGVFPADEGRKAHRDDPEIEP